MADRAAAKRGIKRLITFLQFQSQDLHKQFKNSVATLWQGMTNLQMNLIDLKWESHPKVFRRVVYEVLYEDQSRTLLQNLYNTKSGVRYLADRISQ